MEAMAGIDLKEVAAEAAKEHLEKKKAHVRRLILDKIKKLDSDERRLKELQRSIQEQHRELKRIGVDGSWGYLEWKPDSSEES